MFHEALEVSFKEDMIIEVTFQTGEVKQYDLAKMISQYPDFEALRNRKLFLSGKKIGAYLVIWNDDIDLELETVYEKGVLVRTIEVPFNLKVGNAIFEARERAGITQTELGRRTKIDQSDISKIERGATNPSVNTLNRIATALGCSLKITFEKE